MFKIIFWPFKKILAWLASGLPSGKKEKVEPVVLKPEPIKCVPQGPWFSTQMTYAIFV